MNSCYGNGPFTALRPVYRPSADYQTNIRSKSMQIQLSFNDVSSVSGESSNDCPMVSRQTINGPLSYHFKMFTIMFRKPETCRYPKIKVRNCQPGWYQ